MKKNIYKICSRLLIMSFMVIAISSCKKTDDQPTDPARLFKPSDVKIAAGETSAKLTWTAPLMSTGKALKYSIDFSADSTFATVKYSTTSDTAGVSVTDDVLSVRTKYYARIKAVATETQPESKYVRSSAFQLTGLQNFLAVRELEIKETSVTLRFKSVVGLSSIILTPTTGTATTLALTSSDITAGLKNITSLTANTTYTAELFSGTKSMGYTTFKTLALTTYTTIISSTGDLAATIAAATNGAVIGLNPGTYNITAASTFITQKTITLKSTSGNPSDTKVNFKEIDLEGTGAGITVSGIEFDGTTANAAYFLNLIGSQAVNGADATFTNIVVDNCIVHAANTSFLRGSRGTNAGGQKITGITVNNSVIYDMGVNSSAAYYTFHLDNLQFSTLTVTKSTLYNSGAGLVLASKTITATAPIVNISYCTINGFGGAAKYAILDANANPMNFTLSNSIIANTPKSGTVAAAAIRSTGTGSTTTFSYNNTFGLYSTGTTALTFPATVTMTANLNVDLGWTVATVPPNFQLPVASTLRTASSTSTAIGDPRWTY